MTQISESLGAHEHGIRWDKDEVYDALEILGVEQSVQLGFLNSLLNKYHGLHHEISYYDFLCGEWLLLFSHVVYAAFLHIQRDLTHEKWEGKVPVFSDFSHCESEILGNPHLTRQIVAHVAVLLGNDVAKEICFERNSIRVGINSRSTLRHGLREVKTFLHGSFTKKDSSFVFCRPHLNRCTRFEWSKALWNWRKWAREENFDYPINTEVNVDFEWRKQTCGNGVLNGFTEVLRTLICLYIPVAFLEAFSDLRAEAHSLNLIPPKVIYTANSLHGHMIFKTLAADWKLDGMKILNHQHGGNYGLDKIHAVEDYETRVSDCFFTLGWLGDSPKQRVLPGAISSRYSPNIQTSDKILLNCIAYPANVFRMHFQPMPGTIIDMMGQTASFVRKINGRIKITVRRPPVEFGLETIQVLRQIDNSLAVDDMQHSGIASYLRSALVIHSYLGTSWLETIALNIPTVCFYDSSIYVFRKDALELIDSLKRVGILHESGESAATFVLAVKNCLQSWWNQRDVQDARANFARRYASFSTQWPTLWEEEFKKWT